MARREEGIATLTHIWHIAGPLVHVAYDCSQICRITSHIRLCGPGGDMSSASAALLTFSNHNPMQPASSLTGQDYRLLKVVICNNHYDYCQCSCLVCSIVSLYCPTQFAYLPARCLISARLAYRPSSLLLPCPALARSTARSWHWGKSVSHSKKHLQPPPYTAVLCCAVLPKATPRRRCPICHAPSAPHPTSPPPYTYLLATAYDRALVAAASPCFGRA